MHSCAHDEEEVADVRDLATKTWHAMKRTAKAGQRRTLPDMQVRGHVWWWSELLDGSCANGGCCS